MNMEKIDLSARYWPGRGLPLLLAILLCAIAERPATAGRQRPDFKSRGVQTGEKVPDLTVYTLDGTPKKLSELWRNRPVLLVTASLTCPVARRTEDGVEAIARKFGDRISPIIIYTIEAHPSGSPSPHSGREWVTNRNIREGILRQQPGSLQERLKLAREFQSRLNVSVRILVDGMENRVWKALGGGPNMGILVREGGTVETKQGWLDAPEMSRIIETRIRSD